MHPVPGGPPVAWHTRSVASVLEGFGTDAGAGLAEAEAARRLLADGPNALVERRRRGPFLVFLSQFSDFMVIVLLVAAALAGAIGETLDAVAILVIVVLNAIFGFLHEHRAAQSIALLRALAAPQARVRRSGAVRSVPADSLVKGDIVLLEAGNVVPADLRLTQVASLRVDESVLTGEAHPVDKHTAPALNADEPLGDRLGMAFSGTVVTYGNGVGVVTATGAPTEPPTPTATSIPVEIVDARNIPMRYVPAGEFTMGSDDTGNLDTRPAHTVNVDAFYIDKYEVTNEMYDACVYAVECRRPLEVGSATRSTYFNNPVFAKYPVIFVNWKMAKA